MRALVLAAGLTGFFVVMMGAFGAHVLSGSLSGEAAGLWDKASVYGLAHAASALTIALHGKGKILLWAGGAFVAGVWLFSGALYGLALGAPTALAAAAPFGGLSFLSGWALCAGAAFKAGAE